METIEITLFAEGERIMLEIPPDTNVGDLAWYARTLRGVNTAGYRVNGKAATEDTQLNNGDRVAAVPKGGQLS